MNSLFKPTNSEIFLQINSLFVKSGTLITTSHPNAVCGILTSHRLLIMEHDALGLFKPLFESQLRKGMEIGFIRTFLINIVFIPIVMCKVPSTDISATFEHSASTMRTETILLTFMSFVDMYQYTALGNSIMLLHSILIP